MLNEVVFVVVLSVLLICDEALVDGQTSPIGFAFPTFAVEEGSILALGNVVFNSSRHSYDMTSQQIWVPGYDASTYSFCGRIMYKDTVHMVDKASGKVASFSTSFTFSFHSGNIYDCGHGMAFTFAATPNITLEESTNRSTYGMCIFDYEDKSASNSVFAVKFGSQRNISEYLEISPNISGLNISNISDPSDGTIGLVISNKGNTTVTSYNLCGDNIEKCRFFCGDKGEFTAWIDYDSAGQTLEVRFRAGSLASGGKPPDAVLSVSNVALYEVLDEEMYVGFSSTSVWEDTWIEVHRISSWNFNSSEMLNLGPSRSPVPSTPAGPSQSPDSHRQQKLRGGHIAGITIVGILVVAAVIIGGFKLHSFQQRKKVSSKKPADQSSELGSFTKNFKGFSKLGSAAMADYDVFLNHRGPDLKIGFVSHLRIALESVGLKPFMDKKSLEEGSHAFKSIYDALQVVKVHVAVVSKGYADSEYCLDELVIMTKSKKPIVPVFYDVNPKGLSGLFSKAFKNYKKKPGGLKQVAEWAEALRKLAGITGFEFCSNGQDGDEADLTKKVTKKVVEVILNRKANLDKVTEHSYIEGPAAQRYSGTVDQGLGESSRHGKDQSGPEQINNMQNQTILEILPQPK